MWLGMRWPSLPNQKLDRAVSTSPLPGIGSSQDDVERGQAVGLDHQQLVLAHGVDVAHLAAVQEGQALEVSIRSSSLFRGRSSYTVSA